MLLAARLTGSVVIGYVAFIATTAVTGFVFWKSTAPSRAAARSEYVAATTTGRSATPRPLEIINERYPEIRSRYDEDRESMTPEFAARSALAGALDGDVRDEILAYYDGERDAAYGSGSGAAVRESLVERLEAAYSQDSAEPVESHDTEDEQAPVAA